MDAQELAIALGNIDRRLTKPVSICLAGGAALLLQGIDRMIRDIDILPGTGVSEAQALMAAAGETGIQTDLGGYDPPEKVCLQFIMEGSIPFPRRGQGGLWPGERPDELVFQGRQLRVTTPPVSILAASKIYRCADIDLQDLAAILANDICDVGDIHRDAIELFAVDREDLESSLALVQVFINAVRDPEVRNVGTTGAYGHP